MITGVEHIAIAVADEAEAVATWTRLLGAPPYRTEVVESEQVKTIFFAVGGVKIELLVATSPDSVVARFIEKRGPGLHHIAFAVPDASEARSQYVEEGFPFINVAPKAGADGKQIIFLHPKGTAGALVELCS